VLLGYARTISPHPPPPPYVKFGVPCWMLMLDTLQCKCTYTIHKHTQRQISLCYYRASQSQVTQQKHSGNPTANARCITVTTAAGLPPLLLLPFGISMFLHPFAKTQRLRWRWRLLLMLMVVLAWCLWSCCGAAAGSGSGRLYRYYVTAAATESSLVSRRRGARRRWRSGARPRTRSRWKKVPPRTRNPSVFASCFKLAW
jgi:hypothetical protein